MKKVTVLTLILGLLACLTACGGNDADEQMITAPAQQETRAAVQQAQAPVSTDAAEAEAAPQALGSYSFTSDGVELVPGQVFDPSVLPEADSLYQVPSCAIEGMDNVYNYGAFELTAFDDGSNEVIYSILLTDPNITTPEGLALGDNVSQVLDLYGEGYTQEGNAYVYTGASNALYIILQGESVASIEYRMIVE